jgi:hypothetical protein
MRTLKKFAALAVAVFAVSVVGVASASAAEFTASAKGELVGAQTTPQEFTASGSFLPVVCTKASTTGKVESTGALNQKVKVVYSECTVNILGSHAVNPITAEYNLLASGTVEILNNIKIEVPLLGCTTTVTAGQTVGTVTYGTSGTGILEASNVSGIHSTSSGLCPNGTTGTYKGSNLVHRINPETKKEEGTLSFDK